MCNITVVKQKTNGKEYSYYAVRDRGKKHLFKSKSDAQLFLKNQKNIADLGGQKIAAELAKDPYPTLHALELLRKHGMDRDHIVDAVREYIKRHALKHGSATIRETADAYLASIKSRVEPDTYTVAAQAVRLLCEEFGDDTNPAELTSGRFIAAMESIGEGRAPGTFNSILRRLKTFAGWAERNEYPIHAVAFDAVRPMPIHAKEPRFIKLDEFRRLLEYVLERNRADLSTLFALQYLAGIRTSEILDLKPEDYHHFEEEPYIRVSKAKGASRGRHGRIVPLEPACAFMLQQYLGNESPVIDKGTMISMNSALNNCHIEDRHNIARHSFITYHVAKFRNLNKTVTICGTSGEVALVHYKGLATKSEAEEFFNMPYDYLL